MAKWTPARADTLEALATEILHNYSRGRVLVAVDGDDSAGTARFADDLAAAFRTIGSHVVRSSMDDFMRPEREARGSAPDGLYRDAFDYQAFRRVLAHPFRSGEPEASSPEQEPQPVPADAILLVDGVFLNRPELAGLWNYSVWLDSGAGRAANPLYESEAHPRAAAVAIIDNADAEHPRRVFADAC
ncbi:uridine kinase [Marisediminicola sp. UYEF4]|uniref:hypothetical protein n=1 Tax=Marisediminicola sp. UYEF4 TaxID=1756384 RepID=UPI003394C40F